MTRLSKIVSIHFLIIILASLLALPCCINAGPSITIHQTEVQPGDQITVEFANIQNPMNQDWISIYKVGTPNEQYGEWYYLKGQKNGSLSFTAPSEEGEYEFRLFLNWPAGQYKDVAKSRTIKVTKSQ